MTRVPIGRANETMKLLLHLEQMRTMPPTKRDPGANDRCGTTKLRRSGDFKKTAASVVQTGWTRMVRVRCEVLEFEKE